MNTFGRVWTNWRTIRPPTSTWVLGLYSGDDERPRLGKTCKHGCCWNAGYGSMVLPSWWSPITEEEKEKYERENK